MAETIWFARLKPHYPGGHRCKRYSYDGIRFTLDGGWVRVSERIAKELRHKQEGDNGPRLFDVQTSEQARETEEVETRKAEPAKPEEAAPIAVGRGDAPDVEDLAIEGYDTLSVRRVRAKLDRLSHEELLEVYAYEKAHGHRRTLLKALKEEIRKYGAEGGDDE